MGSAEGGIHGTYLFNYQKSWSCSMDHWLKNFLPGVETLLLEKSSLRDLVFVCKDGKFHSFQVLFRNIPSLGSLPGNRVVICPDIRVHELQTLQDLFFHRPKSLFISCQEMEVMNSLGIDVKSFFEFPHLSKRIKQNRVPCIKNTCQICRKTFSSAQALRNHQALHAQKRPFHCQTCSKGFITIANLKSHIKLHEESPEDLRPFPCPHCPSHFNSNSNLNRHIRSLHFEYSDKKSYLCQVCGKNFTDPSALTAHQKIHTDIPSYVCEDCNKCFLTSTRLRIHKRIHSGVRPYSCNVCGKSFITSSQLKSHTSHKHLQSSSLSKNFLCPSCGLSYAKPCDLRKHILRHEAEDQRQLEKDTTDLVNCPICHEGFSNVKDFRNHLKEKNNCQMKEGSQSLVSSEDNDGILAPVIVEETVGLKQEVEIKDYTIEESIDIWLS